MHDHHGNILAYRLDILKDVIISQSQQDSKSATQPSESRIEFLDLIVDCWLWPDEHGDVHASETTVDDLDEFHEIRQKTNLLGQDDILLVNNTLHDVLTNPRRIVTAVDTAISEAVELDYQ
jgi:hypothetical protein